MKYPQIAPDNFAKEIIDEHGDFDKEKFRNILLCMLATMKLNCNWIAGMIEALDEWEKGGD